MAFLTASGNFSRGYIGDVPRDELPPNAAYRMKDWIPSLGAALRRRSGWEYISPNLNSLSACTSLQALAWAPFKDDEHLMIVADNGKVYLDRNLDGATASFVSTGAPSGMTVPPFWHPDLKGMVLLGKLPISPVASPAAPQKYTATAPSTYAVANLGGTPPLAGAGASWGDYLLLANGTLGGLAPDHTNYYSNRIWVSGVGAPESWTTGTNFWDSTFVPFIVALAPVRAGILVFGFRDTSLIQGDIPPAGGNWSEDMAFHGNGCWDPRTIARFHESVVFANNTGVYMTDGITLADLTMEAGVKTRWQDLTEGFNLTTGWTSAGGVYRNYYIVVVFDAAANFVTCHVFDLLTHAAFEFTNIPALMFARLPMAEGTTLYTGVENLFMATKTGVRVGDVRACWEQTRGFPSSPSDTGVDANGTSVLPVLETPFYKLGGPGKKRIRSARVTYDLRDGGAVPTLAVDYCSTPDGAYATGDQLPATTAEDRQRASIRKAATGIGLRLTQLGQSAHTKVGEIELEQNVLEGMR